MSSEEHNSKSEYFSIFENIKREHDAIQLETINNKILLVDFLNTFIRSFAGSPAMNNNGEHVGGVTGFLYSIGNAIRQFQPTRCILVSDGENSGARKRKIYADYKEKRNVKMNLNRQYDFKNPDEEKQAIQLQLKILLGYLEYLPVQLVTADAVEADDTIAYIAQEVFYKDDNQVMVMSSDKDFLQLVCDRINVWSPTKKKLYTPKAIMDEYGVHPNNFVLYRTLEGDTSDNIGGVKGVGLKTIHKYLPLLSEETPTTINEIVEYAKIKHDEKKKLKFYENIINSTDTIDRNLQLMQLTNPNISEDMKAKIRHQISKPIPLLNKPKIQMKYIHDGLSNAIPDINSWILQTFAKLNSYALSNQSKGES